MNALPKFLLSDYRRLIENMREVGFALKPASEIINQDEKTVYLRHDMDFSAELSVPMAEIEAKSEVSSIYYVLLSGPYNALSDGSVSAIRKIVSLGHEIGLHYDLADYPSDKLQAMERLLFEVAIVESISKTKVSSIVMHEPSIGGQDIFIDHPCFSNPSWYQKNDQNLCYVSDSCRAWRDSNLIKFIAKKLPENTLMLNTHPESWLAKREEHRLTYIQSTLIPLMSRPVIHYLTETVSNLWQTHPGTISGIGDEDS